LQPNGLSILFPDHIGSGRHDRWNRRKPNLGRWNCRGAALAPKAGGNPDWCPSKTGWNRSGAGHRFRAHRLRPQHYLHIPISGIEVQIVSALGQDLPVTANAKGGASFALSAVEHCVEGTPRQLHLRWVRDKNRLEQVSDLRKERDFRLGNLRTSRDAGSASTGARYNCGSDCSGRHDQAGAGRK